MVQSITHRSTILHSKWRQIHNRGVGGVICREGIFIIVINKELSQEPSRPLEAIDQCIHLDLRISLDPHSINSRTKKKICLKTFRLCLKQENNIEWIVHVNICIISNSSPRFVWSSMSLSTKSFVTNLR